MNFFQRLQFILLRASTWIKQQIQIVVGLIQSFPVSKQTIISEIIECETTNEMPTIFDRSSSTAFLGPNQSSSSWISKTFNCFHWRYGELFIKWMIWVIKWYHSSYYNPDHPLNEQADSVVVMYYSSLQLYRELISTVTQFRSAKWNFWKGTSKY